MNAIQFCINQLSIAAVSQPERNDDEKLKQSILIALQEIKQGTTAVIAMRVHKRRETVKRQLDLLVLDRLVTKHETARNRPVIYRVRA